jgi:predicted O-methyltransferase YrrM
MSQIDFAAFDMIFGKVNPIIPGGMTTNEDLQVILGFVNFFQPRRYVEFGLNEGQTARSILAVSPSVLLYTGIDVQNDFKTRDTDQQTEVPKEAGAFIKYDSRVRMLITEHGSAYLTPQEIGEADMVFIDGDHSYEGVKKDSELARSIVKKGVIMWHDYLGPARLHDGVRRYIDEWNGKHDTICLVRGSNVCFEITGK